jgi:hypothetical protein
VETKILNKRFHIPGYHFIKREKVLQLIKDGSSTIYGATGGGISERPLTPSSVQERLEEDQKNRQFKLFPELKGINDPKEFEERKGQLGAAYLNGLTTESKPTRAFFEWKRMHSQTNADDVTAPTPSSTLSPTKPQVFSATQTEVQEPKSTFPFSNQSQSSKRDGSDEMINRITLEHTINAFGPEAQKLSQRKTELIKRVLRGEIGDEESRIDATLLSLRSEISEMTSVLTDRLDELENTLQTLVDRLKTSSHKPKS